MTGDEDADDIYTYDEMSHLRISMRVGACVVAYVV